AMSKAKFEAAKELIREKRYTEARAILVTVAHPLAAEWVAKIDGLAPRTEPHVELARQKNYINSAVVVLVLYFVLWFPGAIANALYYNEAKQMQALAGRELPGVGALKVELI